MTAPFTPEQEARFREIAREEAVKVAHALSRAQAAYAAAQAIRQFRVDAEEIADVVLTGKVRGPSA